MCHALHTYIATDLPCCPGGRTRTTLPAAYPTPYVRCLVRRCYRAVFPSRTCSGDYVDFAGGLLTARSAQVGERATQATTSRCIGSPKPPTVGVLHRVRVRVRNEPWCTAPLAPLANAKESSPHDRTENHKCPCCRRLSLSYLLSSRLEDYCCSRATASICSCPPQTLCRMTDIRAAKLHHR